MGTITPGMVAGEVRWLLVLDWAGTRYLVADEEVLVETAAGDTLGFAGGLSGVTADEEVGDPSTEVQAPNSVSLDVFLDGVDVAGLVASGHDLSAAVAELSRWAEGTTWEERRVVLLGLARDPEYGAPTDPISMTIEASPWEDSGLVPDPALAVVGANWRLSMLTRLLADEVGLAYPVVVGQPGVVATDIDASGAFAGSEAVWVQHGSDVDGSNKPNRTLLVAGHHVECASVMLYTDDYTAGERFWVTNTYDLAGHPIAVCHWYYDRPAGADEWEYDAGAGSYNYSGGGIYALGHASVPSASFQPNATTQVRVFAAWLDAVDTDLGGMEHVSSGAGDVLEWFFRYVRAGNGIGVDYGRWAAAKPKLNRFRVHLAITAGVKPWDYLTEHVLPLLPISIVTGPDGIFPIFWDYAATSAEAVFRLDTGLDPRIERTTGIRQDRSKLLNDVTVRFARSARTGQFGASLRVCADVEVADGVADAEVNHPSTVAHPWARISQSRYRGLDGEPLVVAERVDSYVVWDHATAGAVAAWKLRARALAQRRVSYAVPEGDYIHVERGMVGTVTDDEVALDGVVCLVEDITTDDSGSITLGLLLLEDPIRDARSS